MSIPPKTLRALRASIPALRGQTYVNWGGGGSSPRPVLDAIAAMLRWEARVGSFHPEARVRSRAVFSGVRASAAGLLGAREDEIALTDNTTAGVNIAAAGVDWKPGDEAVVSDLEHPGGYLPWLVWRRRRGVKVRLLRTGDSDDALLENLRAAVGPRTRAVCVSHIAWLSGRRLPIREMSKICRKAGALLIVDGAQSVGQMAVNVKASGADAYTVSGQKWLMGPQGTGALFVRRSTGRGLLESAAGYRSARRKALDPLTFVPQSGAGRFEVATISPALFAGFGRALALCRESGPADIEARVRLLAGGLLEALRAERGVEVLNPPGEAQSGLVAFRIRGVDAERAVGRLVAEHRIILRAVDARPPAIRASIHYVNTPAEAGRIGRAVAEMARAGRRDRGR